MSPTTKLESPDTASASQLIDARIEELDDWRGETLARLRAVIRDAVPDVTEEWKWRGTPVWSHNGILCTGETYRSVVKMTFAKGASLDDPSGLFNASLDGNVRRAIDFREGDKVDAKALKALVRAAAAANDSKAGKPAKKASNGAKPEKTTANGAKPESKSAKPVLLSGGNPQIAKGYGDAPVQAYIAAMPGWKRDVGRRLDALVARTVPGVRKAVKWNSPMYGANDDGWFLGVHCFTKYIKLAFFRGTSLRPVPPVESKHAETRYFHIHEEDELDEAQLAKWVTQASKLPGERM